MTTDLLPKVLPFIYQGLQDADDDNRAVAASALLPVADNLVHILPDQVVLLINSKQFLMCWNFLFYPEPMTLFVMFISETLIILIEPQ